MPSHWDPHYFFGGFGGVGGVGRLLKVSGFDSLITRCVGAGGLAAGGGFGSFFVIRFQSIGKHVQQDEGRSDEGEGKRGEPYRDKDCAPPQRTLILLE